MLKDILGKNELESIKLNWGVAVPGLMTTKCCATGTCDSRPNPDGNVSSNFQIIYFFADTKNTQDIIKRYGYLRT